MKNYILLSAFLCGCSSTSLMPPESDDSGVIKAVVVESDASVPLDSGNHFPESGLCCQVTINTIDAPYWNNGRYECYPESGISFHGADIPWICNIDKIQATSCQDLSCIVGSVCEAPNGIGNVLPCDSN